MAQKAKIVFVNDTTLIADMTVEEAKKAIAEGGIVEVPVSEKKYNYNLNTINIGEKTVPAYDVVTTTKAINAAHVQRVEAAETNFAVAYTGTGEVPEATTEEVASGEDE
jgi:N-dimethylarginine dimethylaminohydrolase